MVSLLNCYKCGHDSASHNASSGKHECFVEGCPCAWYQIPPLVTTAVTNVKEEETVTDDKPVTEEVRTTSATGAQKGVKPARYDLIPGPALDLLARLYGRGAQKYAENNWRGGYEWSKSYAAAQRHLNAFWEGEDIDEEMGLPHVICAAFHLFALATYMTEHPELDDRYSTLQMRQNEPDTAGA